MSFYRTKLTHKHDALNVIYSFKRINEMDFNMNTYNVKWKYADWMKREE